MSGERKESKRVLAMLLDSSSPSPCERGCRFLEECATKRMACGAFSIYVNTGASIDRPPLDSPSEQEFARLMLMSSEGGAHA